MRRRLMCFSLEMAGLITGDVAASLAFRRWSTTQMLLDWRTMHLGQVLPYNWTSRYRHAGVLTTLLDMPQISSH